MNDAVTPLSPEIGSAVSMLAAGDPQGAVALLSAFVAGAPAEVEAHYWLASALFAAGETKAARASLVTAATLHGTMSLKGAGFDVIRLRNDRAHAATIGKQLYDAKFMGLASVVLAQALDPVRPSPEVLLSYGLSLQHQGRIEDALEVLAAMVELFDHPTLQAFVIYALFFSDGGVRRVSEAAKAWGARYAEPLIPAHVAFANPRSADRPLRIGYVGPAFATSQVAQFLLPVLEHHDPAATEIYLYGPDTADEAGLPATARRRSIGDLSDETVLGMVRADGIDILVDVWGHTVHGRLGVFARRAAPVQVAFINFVQTTGLRTMDYVLHADLIDGPEVADLFVETVWPLSQVMAPFRPLPGRPPPCPTPALKNGFVTFGSFNHPAKLSDATVAAWSAILRARPTSRLVLKYGYFIDPVLQRATFARFAAHGVEGAQIEFRGESKGEAYLLEFCDIDLALDPSPCPGGTTTCDALSNGVPVLTLRGEDFYGRIGLAGVIPCGAPELVADTWPDYVRKACDLTDDFGSLDALRRRVRDGFETSALRDEPGFTRGLEQHFRDMFAIWLAKDQAAKAA